MDKIYISEETGSAYWLDKGEVMYAPIHGDNVVIFEEGVLVEVWEDITEEEVREALS